MRYDKLGKVSFDFGTWRIILHTDPKVQYMLLTVSHNVPVCAKTLETGIQTNLTKAKAKSTI